MYAFLHCSCLLQPHAILSIILVLGITSIHQGLMRAGSASLRHSLNFLLCKLMALKEYPYHISVINVLSYEKNACSPVCLEVSISNVIPESLDICPQLHLKQISQSSGITLLIHTLKSLWSILVDSLSCGLPDDMPIDCL